MADNDAKNIFKGACLVDYTGTVPSATKMAAFGPDFVKLIRSGECKQKAVVVIDRGFGSKKNEVLVASDHVNLAGDNPLVGPNDPCGQRFPIVQGIYFNPLDGWSQAVVAGLKTGVKPDAEESQALEKIGVGVCSYNSVPSMLIAAHAGWKVLSVILPENGSMSDSQLAQITNLVEGK
ncbi:MAG: hypothetical protein K2X77_27905 [Candidatus Obscuribacterales bacterium]|jgi:hypothetical protein|nr:hypothetical protein [Candidatus Obscuribacterales bacterium]